MLLASPAQGSSLLAYARMVAHIHSAEERRGNDDWLASRVRVLEGWAPRRDVPLLLGR